MPNLKKIFYSLLTSLILILTPSVSYGAIIFSNTATPVVGVGNTFIVNILTDTETENINAVEGKIEIFGVGANITEVSTGGSALSLWPKSPEATKDANSSSVSFIGGVPGGFNKIDGLLFSIVLKATDPGQILIEPKNITVYKNDGKGTSLKPMTKPLTIKILATAPATNNEWQNLTASDKTPPANFLVTLGQDDSVFEGKKFISFNTTDAESGIDFFEVKEGNGEPVKTKSPYVLRDQTAKSKIVVIAHDKAGNVQQATYKPNLTLVNKLFANISWLVIISAIIILSILLYYFRKNKKL